MKSAAWLSDFAAPHYSWIEQQIVPNLAAVWSKLDVPVWEEYSHAFQTCSADLVNASHSTGKFLYLTFLPLFQLLFIIFRSLFKVLLEQGWTSLQKGAMQAKAGIVWFFLFQRDLTRKEVLGEIGIVSCCVAGYYLRKWLKRQTYWARASRWVANKKNHLMKSYTEAVHRLAKVSLALAMTMPHLLFLGSIIAFKIILPSVVRWLAYDTYTTAALSIWYPFVSTLSWIHGRRHSNDVTDSATEPSTSGVKKLAKTYEKSSTKSKQAMQSKKDPASKTSNKQVENKAPPTPRPQSPKASTTFWLQYWGTYAIVQAFSSFCHMVPVFGRFVAKHPFFISFAAELKLFFFVWVFAMEALLGGTTEDAFLAEALPLRLMTRHLNPILLDIEAVVSEAISKERWTRLVHGKAQRVLDVFVMVRFLSEKNKDWLLHVLDESRVLLIPSVTLFMPGFVTQFGVAYVQYLVPAAKSARARGESAQLLCLQYWTLHCMFFGVLTWLSRLLWWIPFATHAVFIAWCNLSFPKTITEYFAVLEMELVAFGILSGDPAVAVHDTKTAKLFAAITKRLPSAADNKGDAPDTSGKDATANVDPERNTEMANKQGSKQKSSYADDLSETSIPREISGVEISGVVKPYTSSEGDASVQSLSSTHEIDEKSKTQETDENSVKSNPHAKLSGRKAFQALDEQSLASSASSYNNIESESTGKNPAKPMVERKSNRTRSQTTH